jgi:hypothetical protein
VLILLACASSNRAVPSTRFLIALVSAASMMPVKSLPPARWETALGLAFVSAVFDNIPLTALAINQGNCDWGLTRRRHAPHGTRRGELAQIFGRKTDICVLQRENSLDGEINRTRRTGAV